MESEIMRTFGTIIFIAVIILIISWIVLPFMVAGINSRLDKMIRLLEAQQSPQSAGTQEQAISQEEDHQLTEAEKEDRTEKNKRDLLIAGGVIAVVTIVALIIKYMA